MVDLSVIFAETLTNQNNIYTTTDPQRMLLLSELISTAYLNNDNATRKSAESQLEQIQKTSITLHLQELFQMIYIDMQNPALEERIIIYTSALLRKLMNFEKFDDASIIIRLIGLNVLCLFKENIFLKNKMKLSVALEYLINLSNIIDVKSQVILVVLNFLETYLKVEDNFPRTLTKMLIVKVMIHQIFENSPITQKFFNIFGQVLHNLKASIAFLMANIVQAHDNKDNNYNFQIENLEIAILITDVISILFQKSLNDHEYKHNLKSFLENKECLELFLNIFSIQLNNDGLNIVTFHPHEDIVNAINNIKYNIIHSSNVLHHYFLSNEENYQGILNGKETDFPHYINFNESMLRNIISQFKLLICNEKNCMENRKILDVYNFCYKFKVYRFYIYSCNPHNNFSMNRVCSL